MKQQESETSSVKGALSIPTLPTHVTGDLLWAFFPTSITNESFPQTTLPEDMYPVLKNTSASTSYFVRELPYSWDFLLENFMDPGHIPFAHHSLQGARTDGSPIAMEVIANNFTHCEVSFNDQIRKKPRTGVVSFQRPAYYHFRTLRGDGVWKENLKIFSVPIQHGRCRVLFESPLSNSKVPTWLVHAGSNRFLNTDSWLHDAERFSRKSAKLNYLYPTSSDLGTRTFRAWWETNGMANAPPHTYGPAPLADLPQQSRRTQTDPWTGHTKQCTSCRRALKKFKRAKKAGFLTAFFTGILLRPRMPRMMTAISALSLLVSWISSRAIAIIEGEISPSNVGDRSVAAIAK
ncbi:hypothetical protein TrRE_jg6921 [Triparma retinervis]|uniref:Pheophorbide a oxygenase n=1 Tax=Triparma retinervis TaxID=2557542 RepID=A0A9W7L478_9STRA|nr:hypothetical protein TrRE_jg6921 [Triparma retinervis]